MMNHKNISKTVIMGTLLIMFATLFNACKKYDNPPPVFEEYGKKTESTTDRRVLMISIDGAVGAAVKEINPTTIAEMLKTSKSSFNALADARTNNGSSWASMLTGVSSTDHGIVDDQFNRVAGDDPHGAVQNFPSVLSKLLDVRPEFKSTTVTSNPELNTYLIHADHRILANSDVSVRDSVIKSLQTEDSKVTIVNFHDVQQAGLSYGFSADVPEYRNAIVKTDAFVGDILKALKERKNYKNEDWLVMVSSSHGGINKTYGGNSAPERNILSIFYNPNFKPLEMSGKPYYSVRFFGDATSAAALTAGTAVKATATDNAGLYNVGSNGITIQTKILINKNALGDYTYIIPPFLSKTANLDGLTAGWSFFRFLNDIYFSAANGSSSVLLQAPNVGDDGKWHHLTATIARNGDDYKVNLFIDGSKAAQEGTIAGAGTNLMNSSSPLIMGYQTTSYLDYYIGYPNFTDFFMSDVKIWNKVLSDELIKTTVSQTSVPGTDPNYNNLVGYWPANDGSSGTLLNKSTVAGAPNFTINGKYRWDLLKNVPRGYEPADPNEVLLQNIDIAPQIFYWLRVPVKWPMESTEWLSKYEIEFIK
jgi:hypothetical protein